MKPAPYVAPTSGTTYFYEGLSNTITAVDGWRTEFTDGQGREGARLALFITDTPQQPVEVDSATLGDLWPLDVNNTSVVKVHRGPEVWRLDFRVTRTQNITVPAGTFDTYVVQAVETPELVRDPQSASTAMYTWWYAPEVAAVVRFRTSYLTGPATGRVVESSLNRIELPQQASVNEVGETG
ncbi:MAG TPA: DUF3108 domain-containing protein [Longimicrobiaceae bacterium]|nr:DUF3108 domain-containing protein [Longimicrobiaceae bacterium]